MKTTDFDIAIVGYGPVGATLAALMGNMGIKVLILEKEASCYHLPRAVHFDDEVMRVFQWAGVSERLLPKIRVNPGMRFVNSEEKLLLDWPRPDHESIHAWHPSWRFHQPDLETALRDRVTEISNVTVKSSCDVFMMEEVDNLVQIRYEDMKCGLVKRVNVKYVVGCDGARSLVRRFIDTSMTDLGFHERWLVIDILLKQEKPELGDHSIQFCDPERPATYVRGPRNRRRWEIALKDSEDNQEVTSEAYIWQLLSRWLTPEEADIERSAVYTFHSLVAREWKRGRLIIAGDSAHQTPPFMGQGMCAGIRDAANLSWKLAEVIKENADEKLLDTYFTERVPNVTEFINTAVRLGNLINNADSEAALREALKRPDGSAEMKSIYPPLGPGLGRGEHSGHQFGQPRLNDGTRMDDVLGMNYVLVSYSDIVKGLTLPKSVKSLTTDVCQALSEHLESFDARAILLRPDRYILGTARTQEDIGSLLDLLPTR